MNTASSGAAAERGLPLRPQASEDGTAQARVIVKYRADSGLRRALAAGARVQPSAPQHAQSMGSRLGLRLTDGRVLGRHTQALRAEGISSAELAKRLSAQADIEWAAVDGRRHIRSVPNDPLFGADQTQVTPLVGQWYLRSPTADAVSAIDALGAWRLSTGSMAITVAVLDTGVRMDHPDLAGKLHPGYDFVNDIATANDGDLRDGDASDPGDGTDANACFVGDPAAASSWHGTHVAGLIGAASNNSIGMAGTARDVMVLPVRVLGRCGGYDSDIIAGMRWAAGFSDELGDTVSRTPANPHPARVLNLSLGSPGACAAHYRDVMSELNAAGITVVVAAGNDTGHATAAPANCPGALAVAGLRHAGTKVGYSNLGPDITISAPAGNCVNTGADQPCLYPLLTTTNLGLRGPGANDYSNSTFPTYGTSFSAPLVSGTVALMLSLNPALNPQQIRTALQASARAFPQPGSSSDVPACRAPDGRDQLECHCNTATCGAGMLDAAAALAQVVPGVNSAVTGGDSTPAAPSGGSMSWAWLLALLAATVRLRRLKRA